ncbi:cytochrome b561 [Paraburkholderia sp. WC7.3g]|uniref:Cytochrome b n=1 Tax=Paraburkholderia podalyriae TaxID=1938811 RepID=A0ABR7PJW1_9BURK|nr:cytochrome b/b6 domain-containing protein [Paraburkholderia podalyriae]MBC8746660.1 cytochrome b [Paraburkholderia podalyriae]
MHLSTEPRYDIVARLLHWLVVGLVAAQFVIGWTMPDVHRDTVPNGEIAWHLGVGTALLAAMVCRVLWRATHRPPPDNLPPLFRVASKIAHLALYLLLVLVPLLGWINASSRAWTVRLAGWVPLPPLSAAGSSFGHAMGDVHSVLAWVLFAVICLHVAAAMFHQFVTGDRVLQRMKI